jgi:hypothetical protein
MSGVQLVLSDSSTQSKKKISNVALLTFEGAAFNVTFLALLVVLVYPLTMALKQQCQTICYQNLFHHKL